MGRAGWVSIIFAMFVPLVAPAASPEPLDARQPYRAERQRPVTYNGELLVTITPPYKTRLLRVWLPIPPSDPGQELLATELSTFPEAVTPTIATEPVYENTFAYFEFPNPQGAQVIRHKFRIRVWELRWNLQPDQVQALQRWPESFQPYRRNEQQAVVFDGRFEQLLREIVPASQGPAKDLASIMDWTQRHFTYDHSRASLTGSSVHALDQRRGHCSDYHGFCAAMGRLLNQPTRITYGLHTFPKSAPSHCKLEAYLPPYGWVSFDVSETQKQRQAIESDDQLPEGERATLSQASWRRTVSGFRDNTWFLQTRGTDYDLAPPASSKVPLVRTIYAEADGKPLPDPDPSNAAETRFAWMTAQKFQPDLPAPYPYTDLASLREWVAAPAIPQTPPGGAR